MYETVLKMKKGNKYRIVQQMSGEEHDRGFVENRLKTSGLNRLLVVDHFPVTRSIQKKEKRTGLPINVKEGIENLSGFSMANVKVHYNSSKPARIHAHAYTQGTDIHVAPGQEKNLPHEAWHVVQQAQGRVKPTREMKGSVAINDDIGLETEAEVMGAKALQLVGDPSNNHQKTGNSRLMNSGGECLTTMKPSPISNKIIQGTWDTVDGEYIYTDKVHDITWHLNPDDRELWFETHTKDSPYAAYAGQKNSGTYTKWLWTGIEPFKLLTEQASTIPIPEKDKLDPTLHKEFQLYIYLLGISHLKWLDIKDKPPFSALGWKAKGQIYQHAKTFINPYLEREDTGLDAYYGPFYKRINPFLRAIKGKYEEERFDEILKGNTDTDTEDLVEILNNISKQSGFKTDIDENTLLGVLAEIRGAMKEIHKKSETQPINNVEIPFVYRGDFTGIVDIILKECGLDEYKSELDQKGILNVDKKWIQFQFVSTTVNKEIGPPANTGTIWNIQLGPRSKATMGGLYTSEKEILFPPKTVFYIEKIVTASRYDNSGAKGTDKTQYIVFASQGFR